MGQDSTMAQPVVYRTNEQFNRFVADMTAELELLEHDLLGETYDQKKRMWVRDPTTEPVMNKQGVHTVISFIRARVNKNTFISDLSEKTIRERVNSMLEILNEHLFFYGIKYGLSPEKAPLVSNIVGDIVEIALYRAKNAGERDYYGNTTTTINQTVSRNDDRSFLDYIPFIGKKRKEVL